LKDIKTLLSSNNFLLSNLLVLLVFSWSFLSLYYDSHYDSYYDTLFGILIINRRRSSELLRSILLLRQPWNWLLRWLRIFFFNSNHKFSVGSNLYISFQHWFLVIVVYFVVVRDSWHGALSCWNNLLVISVYGKISDERLF